MGDLKIPRSALRDFWLTFQISICYIRDIRAERGNEMALNAIKEGGMKIDEGKKPKISVDLFSGRGQYLSEKRIHPLPEQITAVVKGCLLAMEKLGEIASLVEAIKISFFQKETADYLQVNLTIYMIEPWTSIEAEAFMGKIKLEMNRYAGKLKHAPDSFNPDEIANAILINIAAEFMMRSSIYKEQKAQKLDEFLLRELAPYV